MTEWKSIKIPEATREKAQEDSRTYWELIEAGLQHTRSNTHTSTTNKSVVKIESDDIIDGIIERLDEAITVNVDMSGMPADNPVNRDDVRDWVEQEIRENVAERATRYDS